MVQTVEHIEKEIAQLPQEQLKQFREWYEKFDSAAWDEQIERDTTSGKLDAIAELAITDHIKGQSEKL